MITLVLLVLILREHFPPIQALGLLLAAIAIVIFSLWEDCPRMHFPPWLWYSALTLIAWGVVGLLQKLSTNYISAESSLIWLVAGFLLLEPLVYRGAGMFHYSATNLVWAQLSGLLNALGAGRCLLPSRAAEKPRS